jgi:hypothetical protein
VRILEHHPDLGADLDEATFAQARQALALPLVEVVSGAVDLDALQGAPGVRGRVAGAMVVDGLLVREVALARRVSTALLGPRDVLDLDDPHLSSLPVEVRYAAALPTQLAVLDERLLLATRHWPWIAGRLLESTASQVNRGAAHQAIAQLPRAEDRLVALFWHLADRWGHVRPDGIAIGLPLTHEALGRLIGARRPTVSLGLQVLGDRKLLGRTPDGGWLLATSSLEVLAQDAGTADRLRSMLSGREGVRRPAAARIEAPDRQAIFDRLERLRRDLPNHERRTTIVLEQTRMVRAQLAERRREREGDAP